MLKSIKRAVAHPDYIQAIAGSNLAQPINLTIKKEKHED